MPRSLFTAGLLALPLLTGCDVVHLLGGIDKERTDEFTMSIPESGRCEVSTKNGKIVCVAADVPEISVIAEIKATARTAELAKRDLERITVQLSEEDGVAKIEAIVPRRVSGQVSLTLVIPTDSDLELETTNGAIHVDKIAGSIEAESTNGGIRIAKSTSQKISAETTNGGIHVQGTLMPGEHNFETTNGGIHLNLDKTPVAVEASTRNGRITANGRKSRRGETIRLGNNADSKQTAHVTAETTNGSITITHGADEAALETEIDTETEEEQSEDDDEDE